MAGHQDTCAIPFECAVIYTNVYVIKPKFSTARPVRLIRGTYPYSGGARQAWCVRLC